MLDLNTLYQYYGIVLVEWAHHVNKDPDSEVEVHAWTEIPLIEELNRFGKRTRNRREYKKPERGHPIWGKVPSNERLRSAGNGREYTRLWQIICPFEEFVRSEKMKSSGSGANDLQRKLKKYDEIPSVLRMPRREFREMLERATNRICPMIINAGGRLVWGEGKEELPGDVEQCRCIARDLRDLKMNVWTSKSTTSEDENGETIGGIREILAPLLKPADEIPAKPDQDLAHEPREYPSTKEISVTVSLDILHAQLEPGDEVGNHTVETTAQEQPPELESDAGQDKEEDPCFTPDILATDFNPDGNYCLMAIGSDGKRKVTVTWKLIEKKLTKQALLIDILAQKWPKPATLADLVMGIYPTDRQNPDVFKKLRTLVNDTRRKLRGCGIDCEVLPILRTGGLRPGTPLRLEARKVTVGENPTKSRHFPLLDKDGSYTIDDELENRCDAPPVEDKSS